MVYNMTNLTFLQNATSMTDLFVWSNQVSHNYLGFFLLFGIWVILFITLYKDDILKTMYVSSFICLFISLLFAAIGIGKIFAVVICLIGVIASLVAEGITQEK